MALTGSRILFSTTTKTPYPTHFLRRPIFSPSTPCGSPPTPSRTSHMVFFAKKQLSSRIGKFDSKNKKSSISTREEEDMDESTAENGSFNGGDSGDVENFEGYILPDLPGLEKDFWEGPEWDAFGFFVQYMWAFGILFALISSGIAVATYNEGATDFRETPAFKESIQSQELLEEPDESSSDVFESNPTEEAPTLE